MLSWTPTSPVGLYKLYIARDSEMTNPVSGYFPVTVYDSMWASPKALPDSQAGSAYYWEVVPCVTSTLCAPLQHADHAFNKLSNQVELLSPATGATVSDDVTLDLARLPGHRAGSRHRRHLARHAGRAPRHARTSCRWTPSPTSRPRSWRRPRSTRPTYTSAATTYPEGPIYWRVQALDGSGNKLAWSTNGSFLKSSPDAAGHHSCRRCDRARRRPAAAGSRSNFAKSYDVEIYKNDDRLGNSGNLVLSTNSQQVVYAPISPLAAASTPYTWRIRRVDASSRKGGWSPLRPFTVTGPAPVLTSPADGADTPPSDSLFTWEAEPTATTYRFERRKSGASDITETVTTAATAWAPTKAIAGGSWEWRVTSLDSNGAGHRVLGLAHVRGPRQAPVATTPVGISGSGGVGTALTVVPPVWDMPDVTTTYQWLRDGRTITGATGNVYELTTADYPRIRERSRHRHPVRATCPGRRPATRSTVTPGVPLVATSPPVLSGTFRYGQTVATTAGTWPGTPRFSYQWLRDGRAITGATRSTYRIVGADAGHRLSSRVTGSLTGYAPGARSSATRTVPKQGSVVAATAARVKTGKRGTVAVTVTVVGLTPTGRITVVEGRRTLVTKTLSSTARGRVSIRLPKLRKGKHTLVVRYLGSSQINASAPRKVRFRVG